MKTEEHLKKNTLRDVPLFSEMDVSHLREISEISRLEQYKKNQHIFLENDNYRGFYIVLKGSVKVYRVSAEGKEYILHLRKPPQPFADVPLFEDGGNYPANAQALDDCLLLFIPKQEFTDLIGENPSIAFKMLAGFAKRMRNMTNKMEEISTKEVSSRLARFILEEIEKNGSVKLEEPFLRLTISKATVATYLGTITETLSRTFKKFHDEDIIVVNGKKIFVKDLNKLKQLAK
ncbi:MAG TPA: Crp/Fnr family transcriptional regulator [Ignavibacteriaceae bacterium]|nr:Crp/Fnr family transcriptional regulator [Ignavibacteriaceae bacterium]